MLFLCYFLPGYLQGGKSLGVLQKLIKAKGLEQYAESECDPDSNPVEFALLIWCLSLGKVPAFLADVRYMHHGE
jgi:hypothetical protein